MATKATLHSLRYPEEEPHQAMKFSVALRTLLFLTSPVLFTYEEVLGWVSFVKWHCNLRVLFNAKAIVVEKQQGPFPGVYTIITFQIFLLVSLFYLRGLSNVIVLKQ